MSVTQAVSDSRLAFRQASFENLRKWLCQSVKAMKPRSSKKVIFFIFGSISRTHGVSHSVIQLLASHQFLCNFYIMFDIPLQFLHSLWFNFTYFDNVKMLKLSKMSKYQNWHYCQNVKMSKIPKIPKLQKMFKMLRLSKSHKCQKCKFVKNLKNVKKHKYH